MKKIRKFAALVLTLCVLVSLAAPALAASGVQSELQGSAAYMLSAVKAPEVGSIGGEWAVIGLARSGYPVPANYFDDYYARVEKYVKDCAGVLHERKYTEYSRVILALTAIGRDPANVAGYNLPDPAGRFRKNDLAGASTAPSGRSSPSIPAATTSRKTPPPKPRPRASFISMRS